MPGYVIHLSVAQEYLKKHKNKKEDYNSFIEGVLYPDSVSDKSLTHYGVKSSKSNLFEYIKHNKIDTSFYRGYFLHLLTDYMFYNRYIDTMIKDIMYNDYDLLNSMLIEKYKVKIPEKIKDKIFFKEEGDLKILSKQLVIEFIDLK
ncbi:MAG: hypothetical protein HUJ68_01930, partial [Clostridia bacterium]|nr:hypothetical protein [Clostridia bacterium]